MSESLAPTESSPIPLVFSNDERLLLVVVEAPNNYSGFSGVVVDVLLLLLLLLRHRFYACASLRCSNIPRFT